MTYYKIIIDNNIIGVATDFDFKYYNSTSKYILPANISNAQFILANGNLYHASWMNEVPENVQYKLADIYPIESEEEALMIIESLENQEPIPIELPLIENVTIPPVSEETDNVSNITLNFIKNFKIEQLSRTCNQIIENGFDIKLLDGLVHHFSLTTQDQLNLITLGQMAANGMEEIPYHADGELCKFYTPVEIQMIINEATKFKTYHTTYYNALKNYINSLDNTQIINDIEYGIELPEEYQSNVLKALLQS